MLDLSNPASPQIVSTLFDGVIGGCNHLLFVGKYVYADEYIGGLGIYDGSEVGGPVLEANL